MRIMLAIVLLATTALGQHVLFEEDFENGIPPDWRQLQLGFPGSPWQPGLGLVDGSRDVRHTFHDDFRFVPEDILMSPPIDLSGVAEVWLECSDSEVSPERRVYSAIEITTDGGQSFTPVHQKTGTRVGRSSIKVDISAFAGLSGVQIAFHYTGTRANTWSIDNLRLTTSPIAHRADNLRAGQIATFSVSGGTPGNSVVIGFSTSGAGPLPSVWGNFNFTQPILFFGARTIDQNGDASVSVRMPFANGIPVYSQAIEVVPTPFTLNITNSVCNTIEA